jgi:2-keto-4-pentenoate hydratase/2-oxohepta-3-ene-1,7-dioic acid hydratase in catechol pathway
MKLVRFGAKGAEKPGILDASGAIRDLSGVAVDFVDHGVSIDAIDKIRALDLASLPLAPTGSRIGPCIGRVNNFIAVGLNYADHAAETGAPIPKEPILFNKAPSTLAGPYDDVVIPPGSEKSDWEVELAIVIGKPAYHVSEADALSYVAGFAVCNDLSERAWQTEGTGQWVKGKSAPGFGPLGPWLVTPDEIADVQALDMFLDVNGKRVQTGNTATMIFGAAFVIAYISKFWLLEPGDVITTGTPPGVGMGLKPPVYLKAGDKMHLGITGLGEQWQTCVAYKG